MIGRNFKWKTVPLNDLAVSVDYGHTASASTKDTGVKFLRITDIQNGMVDWSQVPFCLCNAEEQKRYELADGDIVFARTGATTGKSYLIKGCPRGSVFASYLIRVKPNSQVLSDYLFHYFQTADYWRQISTRSTGTAQAGVNASNLKSLKIPLPPLEEQHRIAAILDKADALREKRRQAIAKLDTLLQSVFLDMFGDPVTNPKGWELQPVSTAVDYFQGGRSLQSENSKDTNFQYRVLKVSAVTELAYKPEESKPIPFGYSPPIEHIYCARDEMKL